MQGGVHHRNRVILHQGRPSEILQRSMKVCLVDLFRNRDEQTLGTGTFNADLLDILCFHRICAFSDSKIMGRCYLSSILPVNLVPVVLRRIMAGGNHNTSSGLQVAYRKAEHRNGVQDRIEKD